MHTTNGVHRDKTVEANLNTSYKKKAKPLAGTGGYRLFSRVAEVFVLSAGVCVWVWGGGGRMS